MFEPGARTLLDSYTYSTSKLASSPASTPSASMASDTPNTSYTPDILHVDRTRRRRKKPRRKSPSHWRALLRRQGHGCVNCPAGSFADGYYKAKFKWAVTLTAPSDEALINALNAWIPRIPRRLIRQDW